jgi:copper chaperone CopZ
VVERLKDQVFHISNLDSESDAEKITKVMLEVWGISQAEASAHHKTVSIKYDERMASSEDFQQAVREAGYELVNE